MISGSEGKGGVKSQEVTQLEQRRFVFDMEHKITPNFVVNLIFLLLRKMFAA